MLPGGLRLRGIVDRLDVAPSGDLRVVDYKTGRSPGEAFEGKCAVPDEVLRAGALADPGRDPAAAAAHVPLGDREVLAYSPDEADLLATERKLLALWEAIERATQARTFLPRPSKLCDWCDHKALCPAFGGTLPPMPVRGAAAVVAEVEATVVEVEVAGA